MGIFNIWENNIISTLCHKPFFLAVLVGIFSPVFWVTSGLAIEKGGEERVLPQQIVHKRKYFEMSDLAFAAREIREEAKQRGVDLNEIPIPKGSYSDFDPKSPLIKMSLPAGVFEVNKSAAISKSFFHDSNEIKTIILVGNRYLSVDEMAGLYEAGIRVFQKVYTFSPQLALLVKVNREQFDVIRDQPYFDTAYDYGAQYKRGFLSKSFSTAKKFHIGFFGEYSEDFIRELAGAGLNVTQIFEKGGTILVEGELQKIETQLGSWWIKNVFESPLPAKRGFGSTEVKDDDEGLMLATTVHPKYSIRRKSCSESPTFCFFSVKTWTKNPKTELLEFPLK